MAYEIKRFEFSGTVDADGHILEPEDLWQQYLPQKFVDRALRIDVDDTGYEFLLIDNKPSKRSRRGSLGLLGAMGDDDQKPRPDRRYSDSMPFGACNAADRVSLLDQENLEASLLYPTLGLLWECELTDPELSLAYATAYNRWIADFCRDHSNRLVPIAQLTLLDPEGSAAELERAVKDGCKGAWVNPFSHHQILHGDARFDVIYQKCVELDVPFAIHPTFTPYDNPAAGIFDWPRGQAIWGSMMWLRSIVQQAFISYIALDTLERFPTLKLGILEAGSGWIGSMLDRLDAVQDAMGQRSDRPSATEYFQRQCFISGDPDETVAPYTIDKVGNQCFMWATDYPHPDHPHTWVDDLTSYAKVLTPQTRSLVLGGNVKRIYNM